MFQFTTIRKFAHIQENERNGYLVFAKEGSASILKYNLHGFLMYLYIHWAFDCYVRNIRSSPATEIRVDWQRHYVQIVLSYQSLLKILLMTNQSTLLWTHHCALIETLSFLNLVSVQYVCELTAWFICFGGTVRPNKANNLWQKWWN